MAKKLHYIQSLVLRQYIDCKNLSKKDVSDFNNPADHIKADEEMIRFMLSNTSITDHDSERSFNNEDIIFNPEVWDENLNSIWRAGCFTTYEQAVEAAIQYCLENLILL